MENTNGQETAGAAAANRLMDELRLFVALRALDAGRAEPGALRTVQAEIARLEALLRAEQGPVAPFALDQEDLDNLFLLNHRQGLEPEDKVRRWPPVRWAYMLARKLFMGTQRRYNESVTYLVRRLYATALLTRYYQVRSLALERRLDAIEAQIARLTVRPDADRPVAGPPLPESSREG